MSVASGLLQEDTESHEATQKATVELRPRNMPKKALIEDNFEETDEKKAWRNNQADDTEKKQPQKDMFRRKADDHLLNEGFRKEKHKYRNGS